MRKQPSSPPPSSPAKRTRQVSKGQQVKDYAKKQFEFDYEESSQSNRILWAILLVAATLLYANHHKHNNSDQWTKKDRYERRRMN